MTDDRAVPFGFAAVGLHAPASAASPYHGFHRGRDGFLLLHGASRPACYSCTPAPIQGADDAFPPRRPCIARAAFGGSYQVLGVVPVTLGPMCGRFVQLPLQFPAQAPWPELASALMEMTARYNLAPSQRAAIVVGPDGQLAVHRMEWQFAQPHWAKHRLSTSNARIEKVATSALWKKAFQERRCLVPMTGYYEWVGPAGDKQPYFLCHQEGEQLYAAAIWEPRHSDQDDSADGNFVVITQDAVDIAGTVHDRMPVFLPSDQALEWMTAPPEAAMQLLLAAPTPPMKVYPVTRRVNNARNPDDPSMIEPLKL